MNAKIRTAMIGCGGMARHHIKTMLGQTNGSQTNGSQTVGNPAIATEIVALCEPSPAALAETAKLFAAAGLAVPPNEPDLAKLIATVPLDAAFIITPHVDHFAQAKACLEAGIDVLLEKPMVMNAREAEQLIEVRDRTGKLLVVAFNGSLSPQIRESVKLLATGEFGKLLGISGTIWQGWGPGTAGQWRQVPAIAGGGFMFDTGAHLLNTVADLAGEEFVEAAAWFDYHSRPVETLAVVIARLASGAMVSFHGCGETIRTCKSDIRVFCEKGIIHTGAWGEFLEVQRDGEDNFSAVTVPASSGAWEQFLAVRSGSIANPSPPEVGLRMARLYDAIKASAAQGGAVVKVSGRVAG